jgi:hypothetical protein
MMRLRQDRHLVRPREPRTTNLRDLQAAPVLIGRPPAQQVGLFLVHQRDQHLALGTGLLLSFLSVYRQDRRLASSL